MTTAAGTRAHIDELVCATGAETAESAVRMKARQLIQLHVAVLGTPTMPLDMDVLASLCGIARSQEPPAHSPDAELVPDGKGGVTMRVNADRPETRQRFSVAHEISHTFFPEYKAKVQCRTDARFRDRENPDDLLEMLCDIGAAELLLPQPWFSSDSATIASANDLIKLAATYKASREATVRRYAEESKEPVAAIFLSWKLKPTQRTTVGRTDQSNLFGITPEEEIRDALRLRIDYAIPSLEFTAAGQYLPKDKSIDCKGPLNDAAVTGRPCDGECYLDLGQSAGTYRIWAVPLWTPKDELGPRGENAIAALVQLVTIRKPSGRKKFSKIGPTFFDNL